MSPGFASWWSAMRMPVASASPTSYVRRCPGGIRDHRRQHARGRKRGSGPVLTSRLPQARAQTTWMGRLSSSTRSTVPPLTGDMVSRVLKSETSPRRDGGFNPSSCAEGSAIHDFHAPDALWWKSRPEAGTQGGRAYAPLEAPV